MTETLQGLTLFISFIQTALLLLVGLLTFLLLKLNIFNLPVILAPRYAAILFGLWMIIAVMPVVYCLSAWAANNNPSSLVATLAVMASPGFQAVAAALILSSGLLFALHDRMSAWHRITSHR